MDFKPNFAATNVEIVFKNMRANQVERAKSEVPNVKSLICAVFPYYAGEKEGNISAYARGIDYHEIVRGALEKECVELKKKYGGNFRAYSDSAVYNEVYACAAAGLGVIGKNRLLLTREYGSYVFCGVIATDVEFLGGSMPKSCINCGKCVENCHSGALAGEKLDESLCISAITQKKGELTDAERAYIKSQSKIWGCDECQKCCPYNSGIEVTPIKEFYENLIFSLGKGDLAGLTNREFREKFKARAFTWRGVKPLLRNLDILDE